MWDGTVRILLMKDIKIVDDHKMSTYINYLFAFDNPLEGHPQ